MLDNYSRVRLLTDKYESEGARHSDIGYIIEVYPEKKYEVEFSDHDGISFAQIVAQEDEIQLDEPNRKSPNPFRTTSSMETVYHPSVPAVEQQSEHVRSNKK